MSSESSVHVGTYDATMARSVLAVLAIASIAIVPVESQFPTAFPKVALLSLAAAVALLWRGSRLAYYSDSRFEGHLSWDTVRQPAWLAGVFLVVLSGTVLASSQPTVALWGASGRNAGALLYGSLVIVCLALFTRNSSIKAEALHNAHLACVALTVVYGIVQHVGLDPLSWGSKGPISVFGNLDQAGSWYGMAAVSTGIAAAQNRRATWQRMVAAALAGLAITLVVIVYRRPWRIDQAAIVLAAGVILWSLPLLRRIPSAAMRKWLMPVAVVGAVLLAVTLGDAVLQSTGAGHRAMIWQSVARLILKHPLRGIGAGRLEYEYWSVRTDAEATSYGSDSYTDDAHSVPLQVLVSGGLILAIPYLLLIWVSLRASLRELWFATHGITSSMRALALLSVLYICQAAASPEMPGLAIWGWLASAAVIASAPGGDSASPKIALGEADARWRIALRSIGGLVCAVGLWQLVESVSQIRTELVVTRFAQFIGSGSIKGHSTVALSMSAKDRRREVAGIMRARPADVHVGMLLAQVLREGRDYLGVITIDSLVLAHEPLAIKVRMDLAETYRVIRRPELALIQMERVVKDAPRIPKYWLYTSFAAADAQDTTKAMLYLRRADAMDISLGLTETAYWEMRERLGEAFPYLNVPRLLPAPTEPPPAARP